MYTDRGPSATGPPASVASELAAPACEMAGGQFGDVLYNTRSTTGVADHTRAALTAGALGRYGYVGVLAPTKGGRWPISRSG